MTFSIDNPRGVATTPLRKICSGKTLRRTRVNIVMTLVMPMMMVMTLVITMMVMMTMMMAMIVTMTLVMPLMEAMTWL